MTVGTHISDPALRGDDPPVIWHAHPVDRVVSDLETTVDGLSKKL
jgi:hypothetical protein